MRVMRRVFRKTMPKRSSSKGRSSKPSTTIRVSAPVAGPVGSAKDTVIGGLVVTGMLGFLVLGVSAALGGHHEEPAPSVTTAPIEQTSTNDYVAPIEPLICGVNLDCSSIDHALADKAAWAPAPKKAAKAAKSTSSQQSSTSSGSTASTTKTTSVRTSTSKSGTTTTTRTTSVRTTK